MKFDSSTTDLQRKILEDLINLNYPGNVNEETVQQWIRDYFKLECYKILSDDHILLCVTCGSVEIMDFLKNVLKLMKKFLTSSHCNTLYILKTKNMKAHLKTDIEKFVKE